MAVQYNVLSQHRISLLPNEIHKFTFYMYNEQNCSQFNALFFFHSSENRTCKSALQTVVNVKGSDSTSQDLPRCYIFGDPYAPTAFQQYFSKNKSCGGECNRQILQNFPKIFRNPRGAEHAQLVCTWLFFFSRETGNEASQ